MQWAELEVCSNLKYFIVLFYYIKRVSIVSLASFVLRLLFCVCYFSLLSFFFVFLTIFCLNVFSFFVDLCACLSQLSVPPPAPPLQLWFLFMLIMWLCHVALAWCWWCRLRWPAEGNFSFLFLFSAQFYWFSFFFFCLYVQQKHKTSFSPVKV